MSSSPRRIRTDGRCVHKDVLAARVLPCDDEHTQGLQLEDSQSGDSQAALVRLSGVD
jgi:hypothetical protein